MVAFFFSANRQASQMPSASKLMVFFWLSLVCSYSTAEFGRWLEMTQRLQNTTCLGRPNRVVSCAASGAKSDLSTSCGAGILSIRETSDSQTSQSIYRSQQPCWSRAPTASRDWPLLKPLAAEKPIIIEG